MSISVKGDFYNIKNFFSNYKRNRINYIHILRKYGEEGVKALSEATPKDSGKTSSSWYYEIEQKNDEYRICWKNDYIPKGMSISLALLIQLGHGTKNGSYIEGVDYINPSLKKIFDKMSNDLWRDLINE